MFLQGGQRTFTYMNVSLIKTMLTKTLIVGLTFNHCTFTFGCSHAHTEDTHYAVVKGAVTDTRRNVIIKNV